MSSQQSSQEAAARAGAAVGTITGASCENSTLAPWKTKAFAAHFADKVMCKRNVHEWFHSTGDSAGLLAQLVEHCISEIVQLKYDLRRVSSNVHTSRAA
jgi:hypothetical protein